MRTGSTRTRAPYRYPALGDGWWFGDAETTPKEAQSQSRSVWAWLLQNEDAVQQLLALAPPSATSDVSRVRRALQDARAAQFGAANPLSDSPSAVTGSVEWLLSEVGKTQDASNLRARFIETTPTGEQWRGLRADVTSEPAPVHPLAPSEPLPGTEDDRRQQQLDRIEKAITGKSDDGDPKKNLGWGGIFPDLSFLEWLKWAVIILGALAALKVVDTVLPKGRD